MFNVALWQRLSSISMYSPSGSCSEVSFIKICERISSKVASEHPLLPPPAAWCWKSSITYCAVPDVLFQITLIPEPSYIDAVVDTVVLLSIPTQPSTCGCFASYFQRVVAESEITFSAEPMQGHQEPPVISQSLCHAASQRGTTTDLHLLQYITRNALLTDLFTYNVNYDYLRNCTASLNVRLLTLDGTARWSRRMIL